MTIRILPDFLKHGDAELGFPRKSPYTRNRSFIGTAASDVPVPAERDGHDPSSLAEQAMRDWLGHVSAGRVGPNSQ